MYTLFSLQCRNHSQRNYLSVSTIILSIESRKSTGNDDSSVNPSMKPGKKGVFCPYCNKKLKSNANRTFHMRICPNRDQTGAGSNVNNNREDPIASEETVNGGDENDYNNNIRLVQTSMNRMCKIYRKSMQTNSGSIMLSMEHFKEFIDTIRSNKSIKFYFTVKLLYHQAKDPNHLSDPPAFHSSNVYVFLNEESNIEDQVESAFKKITSDIDAYERNGSGWVVDQMLSIDLGKYKDVLRACYLTLMSISFFQCVVKLR